MDFEEKRNHLLDAVRQASGGKGISSNQVPAKKRAEILRQNYLAFYSQNACTNRQLIFERGGIVNNCILNLRAYEQMTDEEILMSEERESELFHMGITSFLDDYRTFRQASMKVRVNARQRAVA